MSQFLSNSFGVVTGMFSPVKWNPYTPREKVKYMPYKTQSLNLGLTQKVWSASSKNALLNAMLKVAQVALTLLTAPLDALVFIPSFVVGSVGYNVLAMLANLLALLKNKVIQHLNHRSKDAHHHWQFNPKGFIGLAVLVSAIFSYKHFFNGSAANVQAPAADAGTPPVANKAPAVDAGTPPVANNAPATKAETPVATVKA
jgi:hypothetical protein